MCESWPVDRDASQFRIKSGVNILRRNLEQDFDGQYQAPVKAEVLCNLSGYIFSLAAFYLSTKLSDKVEDIFVHQLHVNLERAHIWRLGTVLHTDLAHI